MAEEVTNLARDYGNAGFDIRHKLALNVIYQIPYEPANLWLRNTIGGWQLNTVTIWQSGTPFNVTCGAAYPTCDFNADGNNGDRVNLPGYGTDLPDISDEEWLAGGMQASDFPLPASGTLGTLPRNAYYGPSYFSSDFSLFKNINLNLFSGRTQTLQLRVEAYNVFNTLNLNAKVVSGMEAADALYAEYGESAGGGIRGGKQDVVFEQGNAYLDRMFPKLDDIKAARLLPE